MSEKLRTEDVTKRAENDKKLRTEDVTKSAENDEQLRLKYKQIIRNF
jgi:hypothetical protein